MDVVAKDLGQIVAVHEVRWTLDQLGQDPDHVNFEELLQESARER